ncbi:MAG: peptidylprolyl isomerase [Nannocystaceae bacterium]|nr:peptidylprolyl isomerase [Nannocystaceae bacterium]
MRSLRLLLVFTCVLGACGDDGDGNGSLSGASASTATTASTSAEGSGSDSGTDASASASASTTAGTATDASGTADSGSSDSGGTTGAGGTQVEFQTTLGTFVVELDEVAAPVTSANFLAYVDAGFFDGSDGMGATIVHRIVPGFVIQGGGLTESLMSKDTMAPIVNEFGNGLLNVRGAISMARTNDPDSATSQFFVNLVDNPNLDVPPGYAVFGMVVQGMDVIDAMAAVETTDVPPYEGVPVEPIVVMSAARL